MKPAKRQLLLKQLTAYFPDRWKVERLESRTQDDKVVGTIKIHCLEDDKLFLSDFSARLNKAGKITDLDLDGVRVGKFIGQLHRRG